MITDKMRMVTAKDFFFAAVERGRVYAANIVNRVKKKLNIFSRVSTFI